MSKSNETMPITTVGDGFLVLGDLLNSKETQLGELSDAAKAIGLVIQYRIVPLNETMYNLILPTETTDDNDLRT